MSVKPVTFYRVECDEPDCGRVTQDLGEYAAWGNASDALDQWRDWGGVKTPAGLTYCEEHARGKVCDEDNDHDTADLAETPDGFWCKACREADAQDGALA